MQKEEYELSVYFTTFDHEMLYQGVSSYNANIIDYIDISSSCLSIRFKRNKKTKAEEYIYSESSPVRYQLYRAACFYLAVTGSLPRVKKIVLKGKHQGSLQLLDKSLLTQSWNGCKVAITLPKEIAQKCFVDKDKRIYIIITFFLKAQLDSFSHDAFRAAWSGLNAFYNHLSNSQYESEKLAVLRNLIKSKGSPEAEQYVKNLPDSFWKHIQWHNYIQWRSIDEIENLIRTNQCRDIILYKKITGYLHNFYSKNKPEYIHDFDAFVQKKIRKKVIDANERVRFLVTYYCYMLRNRSFHAGKPYPIFGIGSSESVTTERGLTDIILFTIKDLLT